MLAALHALVYVTSVSTGLALGDTRTRAVCVLIASVLLLQLVLRRRRTEPCGPAPVDVTPRKLRPQS